MLVALWRAGFRRQAAYPAATLNGLATNVFFGIVQTALFLALYRERGEVGGLDVGEALTYVWLRQAIFPLSWSTLWLYELPQRIRDGGWSVELTRPGDPLDRHLAFDLGRSAYLLVVRSPWPLLGAAIVLDLDLPTTPVGVAALVVSLGLVAAIGAEFRFLIGAIAFWSPDYRGLYGLAFAPLYLFSGYIVPVQYFPGWMQAVAFASPLSAVLVAPLAVATGTPAAIGGQVLWVVVLYGTCRAVLARAERRLVVAGG